MTMARSGNPSAPRTLVTVELKVADDSIDVNQSSEDQQFA